MYRTTIVVTIEHDQPIEDPLRVELWAARELANHGISLHQPVALLPGDTHADEAGWVYPRVTSVVAGAAS